ncbi:MAG: hypothetical protein JXL81_04155 [Deltaproteobacteria bacterium]|nr:hypothetical protein [Deltaproteobacteria bacterium]
MSGPKCSRVRLMEREKRRLEAERQALLFEELRRIEEEKCRELGLKISAALNRLEEIKECINERDIAVINKAKGLYKKSHDLEDTENLKNTILNKIANHVKSYRISDSSNMASCLESLTGLIDEITNKNMIEFEAGLKKVEKEIQEYNISKGEKDLFDTAFKRGRKMDISIEPLHVNGETASSAFRKELAGFYAMVDPYLKNQFLIEHREIDELVRAVNIIAQNNTFDHKHKISQIAIRKKSFASLKTQYDKAIKKNKHLLADYERAFDTYNALCKIAGEKATPFILSLEKLNQGIENLNGEIARLDKVIEEKGQTDYITQSVDEVMRGLGYDVIATDLLTTPQKKSIHHIYEYERGNVINVYTSDNGSLLFEVSGIKENDDPMTDLEKLEVKEGMESFCVKYPVIKDGLRKKGVQMDNEDLKPPDIRYARAININRKKIVSSAKRENMRAHSKEKKKGSVMRNGQ